MNNNLRRAIDMSLANNITSNTENNLSMGNKVKNLNGYVYLSSKNSRGHVFPFRASYNDALQYIKTNNPNLRNITWNQLSQMRNNTPSIIIARHPARAGNGLRIGSMRFFGARPITAARNNTPAVGKWVDFSTGNKVPPPSIDEIDAFNPTVKLKNLPYFIEINKNGRKTRFAHTNSKFNTSFPERWRDILYAHNINTNTPFTPANIPKLKEVVPNIEMYYNTTTGKVKLGQVRLVGKKDEYFKWLGTQKLKNMSLIFTKNNLRRAIPMLSDNIPEYKLIKTLIQSGDERLKDIAATIFKLIKIEPEATKFIKNTPNATPEFIQGQITTLIGACHFKETLNQSRNRTNSRLNYLKNLRNQIAISARIFVNELKTSSNKTAYITNFFTKFKSEVGGNPCLEALVDGLTEAVTGGGGAWIGKHTEHLLFTNGTNLTANSRNKLRNTILGRFMGPYYQSLPNNQRASFNKNTLWSAVKNRNVTIKRGDNNPVYVKVSNIPNARATVNAAYNLYRSFLN